MHERFGVTMGDAAAERAGGSGSSDSGASPGSSGSTWDVAGVLSESFTLIAATSEQAFAYLLFGVAAGAVSFGGDAGDDMMAMAENAGSEFVWFVVVAVVQFWLLCGLVRVAVDAARNARRTVSRSAVPTPSMTTRVDAEREDGARRWELLRVSFADYTEAGTVAGVQACGVMLGLLCFLVPGVYFALGWSMALYAVLDHRAHWLKSLAYSRRLTRGSMWRLLLLAVILFLSGIPGTLLSAQAALPHLGDITDFGQIVEVASPNLMVAAIGLSAPLAGLLGSLLSGLSSLLWIYAGAVVYVSLEDSATSP